MANIKLNNNTYPIPDSKLATATGSFIAHLGTIAGSDLKVVIGGVEYGVDAAKVAGAVAEIEAVLGGLNNPDEPTPTEERLEGDGAEFYTLAPTALSFRSTAPLNELQEIQINGVTVDPSNYTLEEGSTIVTFPIDYLKTLNVGSYEVNVVSDSKAVKGDFSVVAPEVNEYGFYYNQPYSEEVPGWGRVTFFIREDGTYDLINGYGAISTNTYTVDGNSIVALDKNFGAFHCTVSSDGTEIYCTEVQTALKISNDVSIAADEDYIYIYREELGGYEVIAIDKTKAKYGAIKTGINGINTVKLADYMFASVDSNNMPAIIVAPQIPDSVMSIGEGAFYHCASLESIVIPKSITTIGKEAFISCTSLESITFVAGSNLTALDARVFQNCSSLTSIEIPVSVTFIDSQALQYTSLVTITFEGTVAEWNAITKGEYWNQYILATHVQCSDGQVSLV